MRGLKAFISDIRKANSKEAERKRVDKELAHIRAKFTRDKLDGYSKKKYVWKLVYIYMLGYDVEVGHIQALQLVTSVKYSEKNSGYMACSVLFNETHELLRLIIQTLKKDLEINDNPTNNHEVFQSLALSCMANVGGQEMAESLSDDVHKLLLDQRTKPWIKKKASLCLLRLIRKYPDCIPQGEFPYLVLSLLEDSNLGVVCSVMSLVICLVSRSKEGFESAPNTCINVLIKLVFNEKKSIYKYYLTLCPWLQIKLLRLLQYFPPPQDTLISTRLTNVLSEILRKNSIDHKNLNRKNADHAILFEAVNVISHLGKYGQTTLLQETINLLGSFVSVRKPNFRYLALESMARMASVPGTLDAFKSHQNQIQLSLKDQDISIRKRALDLLFVMADKTNAKVIVHQLLKYLQNAAYDMREELVLKIAIIAEKFATDLRWYVDVIIKIISLAGDFVADEIWHRVIQIVTNTEELQDHAATTCYKYLNAPSVHETGLMVGAYILGEFGHQIKDTSVTGVAIFDCLRQKFATASPKSQSLILSCYIKMANTYPELKDTVSGVFQKYQAYVDTEMQQRACEYSVMNAHKDEELMNKVFDVMPNFPERESLLLKRLKAIQKGKGTDQDAWAEKEPKVDEDRSSSSGSKSDSDKNKARSGSESGSGSGSSSSGSGSGSGSGSDSGSSSDDDDTAFAPQDIEKLKEVMCLKKGVLYESNIIQIGFKLEIQGGCQIKMGLFYGNKNRKYEFKNITLVLPTDDSMTYKFSPQTVNVPCNKQVKQDIVMESIKPFPTTPKVKLEFKYHGKSHHIDLFLPVLLYYFITPNNIKPENFLSSWQSAANECKSPLKCTSVNLEKILKTFKTFQLTVLQGVDKNQNNITATGIFNTSKNNLLMPCYIRLETRPHITDVRLTIRSGSKFLSDALFSSMITILGATRPKK